MRIFLALAAIVFVQPALAWSFDDTNNLAQVIAGEAFCGLVYDQARVATWTQDHVPSDAASFTSDLNGAVFLAKGAQDRMSQSQKTAHCVQISRLARSYSFTN